MASQIIPFCKEPTLITEHFLVLAYSKNLNYLLKSGQPNEMGSRGEGLQFTCDSIPQLSSSNLTSHWSIAVTC